MSDEAKALEACPNPWCRYNDPLVELTVRHLGLESPRRVECECGIVGPAKPTEAEAIVAWNTLIEPEGAWTQGAAWRDRYGTAAGRSLHEPACWCAVGAILEAAPSRANVSEKVIAFASAGMKRTRAGGLLPLAQWNDAPERTQAEVVAKLREAAVLAHVKATTHD